ncbi:phage tail tape measure protein [Tessaracoccus palaemonis]|uniref:Phage tail tape measure protein n=1 Tax=Tessaracoccus palaemonis TaxID=2829499 RepID=A0ABX8SNH5_9ACTN|nr:phage tail tape measure protein [Tessaracoccus palaemonis]QXT62759.1 phage tail tape measure protein [Tessaracoccus palaemonis]
MTDQVRIALAVDAAGVDRGTQQAVKGLQNVEKAAQKAGTSTAGAGKQATTALDKQAGAAADAASAETGLGSAAEDAGAKSAAASEKAAAAKEKEKEAADKVGNALLAVGAIAVAVAAGSVAAATNWESAYAGVRKTVDGTAEQMASLEGDLRGITKVASASHTEVAAVAEAAGQLGVKRDDVAEFTKVMIDLGVATNLTAEEGAVAIRQFMNIMGSAAGDVERIASSIVALGNNSATTEADIVAMAQRLAGAGKQARMSESEVLAISAAMASVGIEAEAGGTAMSLTLKQIDGMVRAGGDKLETLGEISGMTGAQFAAAWGESAADATNTLVLGLGRMGAEGEDVNATLSELGFEGIRQTDTLLRLSGATQAMGGEVDLLTESLKTSAEEFERNTALQIEAETRYGTTAEKAKIAANSINDGLIDLGNSLLPIANDGIQVVTDLASAFGSLPDSVQGVLGSVTLLTGVVALGAGGALKAVTAFQSTKAAVTALGTSMRTASLAGGAIGLALAAAAAVIGSMASAAADAQAFQDDLGAALRETNGELRDQNGLIYESIQSAAAKRAQDLGLLDIASEYGLTMQDVTSAMLGDEAARQRLIGAMDAQIDKSLELADAQAQSGEYSGDASQQARDAADARTELARALGEEASNTDSAVNKTKQLLDATGQSTDATKDDADATSQSADEKARLAQETQQAEQELRNYVDALFAESDAQMQLLNGTLDFSEASLNAGKRAKEWKDEAKEAGESTKDAFDTGTRAGIENNRVMGRMVEAAKADVKAKIDQNKSTKEITKTWEGHRKELIETATQFTGSKKAATAYVDKLMETADFGDIETAVELNKAQAQAKLDEWEGDLKGLPDETVSKIKAMLEKGQVQAAEAALNQAARDRDATIRVHVEQLVTKNSNYSPSGSVSNLKPKTNSAAGNLFMFNAAGNISRTGDVPNAHQPTIVPAGTNRLFAEDETGGEAYIPLRNDWRRARAIGILGTVAARFGLGLVQPFAAGGTTIDKGTSTMVSKLNTGVLPLDQIKKFGDALTKATKPISGLEKASKEAKDALSAARTVANDARAESNKANADLAKAKKIDPDSKLGRANAELAKAQKVVDPSSKLGKAREATRVAEEKLAAAKTKSQREAREKDLAKAQAKQQKLEDARQRRIDRAQEKADYLAAAHEKKVADAQKAADKAEKNVNKAIKERTKAEEAAEAASAALTKQKQKEKDAAADLLAAQQALADSARSAADSLVDQYLTGGDAADLVDNMNTGAAEMELFAQLIEQLRKLGLDESVIQEIIEQGVETGSETAADIIARGPDSVAELNKAAAALRDIADKLGLVQVVGVEKHATGSISRVGDIPNGHLPELVPAGTNRLFGERETGGEAYIPLQNDWRRPRALQLWAETGRRLGAQQVRAFAAGDVIPGSVTFTAQRATPTTVHNITQHNQVTLPSFVRDWGQAADYLDGWALAVHQA